MSDAKQASDASGDGPAKAGPSQKRPFSFFVAPAFFGLAAFMVWGPVKTEVPEAATPSINRARIQPAALREVLLTTDPPSIFLNGYDRACMECHRTFENLAPRMTDLQQHSHIEMQHGINTHCYHCHDYEDRNMLVLRDGTKVSFPEVPRLCEQCHQRLYEDWKVGVHGKRFGHWNTGIGEQTPIVCTGCHDPHWPSRPAMDGMRPMAGPNTLRMGGTEYSAHDRPTDHGVCPLRHAVHGHEGPAEGHAAQDKPAEQKKGH